MPGQITHYLCAVSVLSKLSPELQSRIKSGRGLYNTGAQGPDIFFYYLPGFLNPKIRGIAHKMHKTAVGDYLKECAVGIKYAKASIKADAFAYLAGYITHYCLDCATHPYVYYKTGFRQSGEKFRKRLKYSSYHVRFESAIDTLMLKRVAGKAPKDCKIHRFSGAKQKDAERVADFIGGCISRAYRIDCRGKDVLAAQNYMQFFTKLFQATNGRYRKVLAIAEGLVLGENIAAALIHPQRVGGKRDYLNEKKADWSAPWDKSLVENTDFCQMFSAAAEEAAELIYTLDAYLKDEVSLDYFLEKAGNRSLNSGRPIEEGVEFKFHDIIFN